MTRYDRRTLAVCHNGTVSPSVTRGGPAGCDRRVVSRCVKRCDRRGLAERDNGTFSPGVIREARGLRQRDVRRL